MTAITGPSTGPVDEEQATAWALAAGRGDQAALAAWIRFSWPIVFRFLRFQVRAIDAEDLTQETMLRAVRTLDRFEGRSSARTWVLAVARHVVLDYQRRQVRRVVEIPAEDDVWAQTPAAGQVDELVALRLAVQGLPPARRLAFELTQLVGLSYPETARLLGCPVGTVRSRVARAREDLMAVLADRRAA